MHVLPRGKNIFKKFCSLGFLFCLHQWRLTCPAGALEAFRGGNLEAGTRQKWPALKGKGFETTQERQSWGENRSFQKLTCARVTLLCIRLCTLIQNNWHKELKEGNIYFSPWCSVHLQDIVEQSCSPHSSQEAEGGIQEGTRARESSQGYAHNDLLPPTRPYLLQFSPPPSSLCKFWIHPQTKRSFGQHLMSVKTLCHGRTQGRALQVSKVSLDPMKLTVRINHHTSQSPQLEYCEFPSRQEFLWKLHFQLEKCGPQW
jgi:hypothetical protein